MRRSEAIRLFLFLLVVSLAGITGCKNFFVPVCQETNTCTTGTPGTGGAGSPTITSISPTSGSSGTTVTLTGTNYTGATAVNFGSTAGTSLNVVSATQITVVAPAGSGAVNVTVTNSSGTSNGVSFSYGTAAASSFIYVANQNAGTVAAFSLSAGTLYTVSGSPFTLAGVPTAIATTPSGSLLYEASSNGGIYVYTLGSNGAPTLGNNGQALLSLVAPTYMAIDSTGTWLFVVSSTASQLLEYQITPSTGALTAVTGSPVTLHGGDPTQIYITPNNQYVYVGEAPNTSGTGDAGVDVFTLNATSGALSNPLHINSMNPTTAADDALGSDAKSKFLFVGETASGIRAFSIGTGGSLSEVAGSPFPSALGPSAIAMDPTNAYVYVAYRYADKIEGYSLGSTGALTLLSSSPFATGSQPIAMSLDANSQYMVVANSGGNPDLEIFSFDTTSAGKLDFVANTITGSDPTVPISMAVAK